MRVHNFLAIRADGARGARGYAWIATALFLAWFMLHGFEAYAYGLNQCAADRAGSSLGCTANDVSITSIAISNSSTTSCTAGTKITLDLDLTVHFQQPSRYDIGIFVSNDGKDPTVPSSNGGAGSCSVAILPTTSPFKDLDGDACGDGNNSLSGVLHMSGVEVPCQTVSGTGGNLYIPFVVSWDNQGGNYCTSAADPLPSTGSKCNAPTASQQAQTVNIVVLPRITIANGVTSLSPGESTAYTVVITNNTGLPLSGAVFKDPVVTNLNVNSVACSSAVGASCPAAGSVTVDAMQNAGIAIPDMPVNGTVTFTINATVDSGATGSITNTASVIVRDQPGSASDTDSILAQAVPGCGNGTVAVGVINTYYSGTKSASAGATSISVGTPSGSATAVAANDLLLVVQVQDENVNWENKSTYGSVVGTPGAGAYEYVVAAGPVAADGTLALSSGLRNSYTAASYVSNGAKSFQVIRVPQYSSAVLPASGLTAKAWDGRTGGVLAFDVAGTLNLNSATVDVSGKGFRGGGGRRATSGSGSSSDYRTPAISNGANGAKGEGVAGTPYNVYDGYVVQSTGAEGYPNGSNARGAPANAGGGGTDGNPSSNDQNTGGGGGGNYGAGGQGGWAWCSDYNWIINLSGCDQTGGVGGASLFSLLGPGTRLSMGGGGGAGTSNNGTGTPANGVASSGARGGGIIMIRAGSLTGTATFNANGADGNDSVGNDGSGGGGAGGSVLLYAKSGGIPGAVVVNAKGGKGGDNTPGYNVGPHGPGGGGGGGYVVTSSPLGAGKCNVAKGAAGITASDRDLWHWLGYSGNYGAEAGTDGACTTNSSLGAAFGSGPCASTIGHYAVSNSGSGITCEAEPVTITAHDASHARVDASGRTITVTAKDVANGTASGTWVATDGGVCTTTCYDTGGSAMAACGNTPTYTPSGASTGTATYKFAAGESAIQLCLKQSNSITETFSVSDGMATDSENRNLVFSNTGLRFYADGTVDSLGNLLAGLRSDVVDSTYQPAPQALTIRALKTSQTTPARCVPLLAGTTRTIKFGYQCIDPNTCQVANGLEVNGTGVAGSNSAPISFTDASVDFNANGYGTINLKYWDVGQIELFAQAAITDPATGGSATLVTGASNTFLVKPFGFAVIPCAGAVTSCTTAPTDPGTDASGAVFTRAGAPFKATISAVAYGGTRVTPSFGMGTGKDTETVTLSHNLVAPSGTGAVPGSLGGTISLVRQSFANGVATASDLTWSEVGIIKLVATNATFEGQGVAATGQSARLGRFTPDHFDTVVTQGCSTGGFTYSAQPFTVLVKAMNGLATPSTTRNYDGSTATAPNFAKAVTLSDAGGATAGTLNNASITAEAFTQGEATTTTPTYVFASVKTAPTTIKLRAKDADVTAAGLAEGQANIRSGRLWLTNAYGNEFLKLPVPMQAQYWLPTGWQLNRDDSCTRLVLPTEGNSGLTNALKAKTTASMGGSTTTPVTLTGGDARFLLSPPGLQGVVDISSQVLLSHPSAPAVWLPPNTATARACFGRCGPRSSVIYIRERF